MRGVGGLHGSRQHADGHRRACRRAAPSWEFYPLETTVITVITSSYYFSLSGFNGTACAAIAADSDIHSGKHRLPGLPVGDVRLPGLLQNARCKPWLCQFRRHRLAELVQCEPRSTINFRGVLLVVARPAPRLRPCSYLHVLPRLDHLLASRPCDDNICFVLHDRAPSSAVIQGTGFNCKLTQACCEDPPRESRQPVTGCESLCYRVAAPVRNSRGAGVPTSDMIPEARRSHGATSTGWILVSQTLRDQNPRPSVQAAERLRPAATCSADSMLMAAAPSRERSSRRLAMACGLAVGHGFLCVCVRLQCCSWFLSR